MRITRADQGGRHLLAQSPTRVQPSAERTDEDLPVDWLTQTENRRHEIVLVSTDAFLGPRKRVDAKGGFQTCYKSVCP